MNRTNDFCSKFYSVWLNPRGILITSSSSINSDLTRRVRGVTEINSSYDGNDGIDKRNCKLKYITALLLVRPLGVQ